MIRTIILSISTSIILTFCQQNKYTVEYRFRDIAINNNSHFNEHKDSLLFFFEGNYANDIVTIVADNGFSAIDTIHTDDAVGLANVLSIGIRSDISKVTIQINNGGEIPIKIDTTFKFIAINYFENKVLIEYLKKSPMYY